MSVLDRLILQARGGEITLPRRWLDKCALQIVLKCAGDVKEFERDFLVAYMSANLLLGRATYNGIRIRVTDA